MHEHGTKTSPIFLRAYEEASLLLLPRLVSLLSGDTVQPENIYSCILKVTGQASTLMTATPSIHVPNPLSTDLRIKPDLVSTNPIGKDEVRNWSM